MYCMYCIVIIYFHKCVFINISPNIIVPIHTFDHLVAVEILSFFSTNKEREEVRSISVFDWLAATLCV